MKLVVTGATGYIGRHLVQYASALGHEVVAATRHPLDATTSQITFDLYSTEPFILPGDTDAVIHLAATTTPDGIDPDKEVAAGKRVIKAAQDVQAKLIFVSSQTARADAPTTYGQTKWLIERDVLAANGCIVRPGMVYGGIEAALFGTLVNLVRHLPAIPAFLPSPRIQPVHVDDLSAALIRCAALDTSVPLLICVGAATPVSFTHFLRTIARQRVRRFRLPIPIPTAIVRLAGAVLGTRFGLDRLTSLFDLPTMDTKSDLRRLGISLRPLSSGMTRSGADRRRSLIREGKVFLQYILREQPAPSLVRMYVRCIETLRNGRAMNLPAIMLRFPVFVATLENPAAQPTPEAVEFNWRLNAAIALGEASIQGASRFLALHQRNNAVTGLISLARTVMTEIFWRILGVAASPLLHRRKNHLEFSDEP